MSVPAVISLDAAHAPVTVRRRPTMEHLWLTRYWILVTIVVVAGLTWMATLERGAGPASGAALLGRSGTWSPLDGTFRVGHLNIHGGRGDDGQIDLERTTTCLEGLDFVGLNELHDTVTRGDQAAGLGQRLGLNWLFAPTERTLFGEHFGSGILSRVPVRHWQRIPLAREHERSYRNVVLCRAEVGERPVNILVTHLALGDDRSEQLRTVTRLFLALEPPAILMGDLNTPADDPVIRDLKSMPGVTECVGNYIAKEPARRVDWIFSRGLTCVTAACVPTDASDHPLVWAEFQVR